MQDGSAINLDGDYSCSKNLWDSCASKLSSTLDPHFFSAYIKPLKVCESLSDNEQITILTPSSFLKSVIEKDFYSKMEAILRDLSGNQTLRIAIKVDTRNGNSGVNGGGANAQTKKSNGSTNQIRSNHELGSSSAKTTPYVILKKPSATKPSSSSTNFYNDRNNSGRDNASRDNGSRISKYIDFDQSHLNTRYVFDNFVVGKSNEFCNAAALRVAENPGQSYNPLFIYGGVGLGKTHILHSIGNAVLEKNPNSKVLYISAEAFTNELIQALRHARMDQFKARLRSIELLLIDDIQFISGKERTQEEFFHTFNALYNAKHQIVLTSDTIPSEIQGIEERLQTRFSWGLTADIQSPDLETRIAILKRKASIDKFHLPEEVALLIAEKISSNVRELEGALTRLHAFTSLKNIPISIESTNSALGAIFQPKKVNISIDDIKKGVSQHFSIKVSEMTSKKRTKNLSFPRHIAMYLCRKHTTASYPEIGSQFGGRDHSSVIHAANVVTNKITDDSQLKSIIVELEKKLLE